MMPHLHSRSGINVAIHLTQFRRMCWEVELYPYKDFNFFAQVAALLVRAKCAALYAARSDRLVGYAISLKIDLSNSHLLCAWDAIVSHT